MRRVVAAGIAGVALTLIPGLGAAAGATSGRPAKTIAAEICEPMVRNAVEASLGAPIPAAQQGAWAGRTFTCTYPLTGGRLVLAVDDVRTTAKARATYRTLNRAVRHPTRLNGLGDRAYQAPDGTIVAVKDQFVLRVDPGAAPPGISKSDLAFAAVVAVMSCWTGGT
jgi:hypothetical protein